MTHSDSPFPLVFSFYGCSKRLFLYMYLALDNTLCVSITDLMVAPPLYLNNSLITKKKKKKFD